MKLIFNYILSLRKSIIKIFGDPKISHLHELRKYEINMILKCCQNSSYILEIGGGTGFQAKYISSKGYSIETIDLQDSNYLKKRIYPITNYDGKKIPFKDNEFDLIFSSNVLEHIDNINEFEKEIFRVCSAKGKVIHILPSSTWRIWTSISHFIKYWSISNVHGVKSKNIYEEIKNFDKKYWVQHFKTTGWKVKKLVKNNLFYTGTLLLDDRLSIKIRFFLSKILGSSCNIFILGK